MKKLTLLTFGLLFTTLAQANLVLETTFAKGDQEVTAEPMILEDIDSAVEYSLGDVVFKVVLTSLTVTEETYKATFDVFTIQDDTETLIAQPEIAGTIGSPASLTLADGDSSIALTINHVE